jgi:TRAP-type transport system periplasmic protein
MSSSPEVHSEYKPTPLWPWLLASFLFFVIGAVLLKPESGEVGPRTVSGVSATPSEGLQDLDIPEENGTMRFVCVDSPESSFAKSLEQFRTLVEAGTHGRVKIQVCPSGQIGRAKLDELAIVQAVRQGKVSFGLVTSSPLSNMNPSLEVMDLPFLFRDYQHADRILLGPVGAKILSSLTEGGVVGLATFEVGFRIFSSSRAIRNMEDFRGKKLRVMQSAASISMVRMVGGEAVPSPVDKILMMAREGYIDAADRTYPTYWDFKLYEVHRHISDTRHSYTAKIAVANDQVWKNLKPEDRKVILGALRQIEISQRKLQRQEDLDVKKKCQDRGIEIHEFSQAERNKLSRACLPLYTEYKELYGSKLLDQIRR